MLALITSTPQALLSISTPPIQLQSAKTIPFWSGSSRPLLLCAIFLVKNGPEEGCYYIVKAQFLQYLPYPAVYLCGFKISEYQHPSHFSTQAAFLDCKISLLVLALPHLPGPSRNEQNKTMVVFFLHSRAMAPCRIYTQSAHLYQARPFGTTRISNRGNARHMLSFTLAMSPLLFLVK